MIELVCAMGVMAIGLLAVFSLFQSSIIQIKRASTISTAAALADSEMESYRAITYSSIGLGQTAFDAADSTYVNSSGGAYMARTPAGQANTTVIVTACPGTPCTNSVPTKTVTGADNKSYRVDTYVTWQATANSSGTAGRNVKLVTIIVRGTTNGRTWARVASSFDQSTGL